MLHHSSFSNKSVGKGHYPLQRPKKRYNNTTIGPEKYLETYNIHSCWYYPVILEKLCIVSCYQLRLFFNVLKSHQFPLSVWARTHLSVTKNVWSCHKFPQCGAILAGKHGAMRVQSYRMVLSTYGIFGNFFQFGHMNQVELAWSSLIIATKNISKNLFSLIILAFSFCLPYFWCYILGVNTFLKERTWS